MKKFTRFALSLALFMLGGATAFAQEDEVLDFDASFYHKWSEVSATAIDNGEDSSGGLKLNEEVSQGNTIWGNLSGSVPYLSYANITDYSELRFEGTPGATLRLMCNRTVNEDPIFEFKPTIGEDGKLTVKISALKYLNGDVACDFVCLQSIKVPYGSTAATITSIKIVKPGDPLSVPKDELKKAINDGKMRSALGKTEESFSALTTAIAAGETALAAADATAESLGQAKTDIDQAIAGLQLKEGYTNLTSEMYFNWTDPENPVALNYETVLYTATGQPYGDSSVKYYNYADISAYEKLIVGVASGTPRIMMNREEPLEEGAEGYDANGGSYVQIIEEPVDGVVEVDLTQYEFAHLNAIKSNAWGAIVTVTDLLLYKTPVVEPEEEVLDLTIDHERMATQGYTATTSTADLDAAKEFLGVETLTTDMIRIENPDGTLITDYATYDGWFDGEGTATIWGDDTKVCVKFFQAIEGNGEFDVCDMNGADEVGKTYTVKWRLVNGLKSVRYTINVTFTEFIQPVYKPEIIATIDVPVKLKPATAYEEATAVFNAAEVASKLGLNSLNDAKQYIVNVTDGNFVSNTTDGWRNADGDAAGWNTGAGMVCVKIEDPSSGTIDYLGAIDDTYVEGATYTAKWGFVNDEDKAVVLNINITFTDTSVGINAVSTDNSKATVYNLRGQRVQKPAKGLYIIGGKKIVF